MDGLSKLGSKKALDFVVFENPLPVVLPLLVFNKASGICNMCNCGQLIYIPFLPPPPPPKKKKKKTLRNFNIMKSIMKLPKRKNIKKQNIKRKTLREKEKDGKKCKC